ncbi:MAG TPA: methylated-DNA--[protein]-cysteine S-methyltransferase [Candidatus Gallacutalibacter stercoravium]|nr:methylated-DNA--[protein]-cysteine S-methyltransferase [Candidatus Gallacutalibacter stercoravium]
MEQNFREKIYTLTAQIPAGKVATYGQLALLAGSPRASRIAGAAMYRAPAGLPCHRVVYASGRLSPPDVFGPGIQRALLEQEGVPFLPDGRVDLAACLWRGTE